MAMVRTGSVLLLLVLLALTDALVMHKVLKMQQTLVKDLRVVHSEVKTDPPKGDPNLEKDKQMQFGRMNETEQKGACFMPGMPCSLAPNYKKYPKMKGCCLYCAGLFPMCKKKKKWYRIHNVQSDRWLWAGGCPDKKGVMQDGGAWSGAVANEKRLEVDADGSIPEETKWKFHKVDTSDGARYRVEATSCGKSLYADPTEEVGGTGAIIDTADAPDDSLNWEIKADTDYAVGEKDSNGNTILAQTFRFVSAGGETVVGGRNLYAAKDAEWAQKWGGAPYKKDSDDQRWYITEESEDKYITKLKDD